VRLAIVLATAVTSIALMGQAATPPPAVPKPRFVIEADLDRSGSDLRRDVLDAGATVDACEARCLAANGCVAFTFVKQSTTVPQPICWLKNTVPTGYKSSCCISGVLQR